MNKFFAYGLWHWASCDCKKVAWKMEKWMNRSAEINELWENKLSRIVHLIVDSNWLWGCPTHCDATSLLLGKKCICVCVSLCCLLDLDALIAVATSVCKHRVQMYSICVLLSHCLRGHRLETCSFSERSSVQTYNKNCWKDHTRHTAWGHARTVRWHHSRNLAICTQDKEVLQTSNAKWL